jgi:hypothetical protein
MVGIFVPTPTTTLASGGLFAVAATLETVSDDHYLTGVDMEIDSIGTATIAPDPCALSAIEATDGAVALHVDLTVRGGAAGTYTIDKGNGTGTVTLVVATPDSKTKVGGNVNVKDLTYVANGSYTITVTGPDYFRQSIDIVVAGGNLVETVSTAEKIFAELTHQHGDPFPVYKGIGCYLFNHTEHAPKATRSLEIGEQRAVEERVWNYELAKAAIDLTPVSGTAVEARVALGILEEYAGTIYGGVPVVHTGKRGAIMLATQQIANTELGITSTVNGSLVANGNGYTSPFGPGGVVAGAGELWLYISGPVHIWRGDVTVSEAFILETNQHVALAERYYVVVVEQFAAAILMKVE